MTQYQIHPAADLFPMIDGEPFDELVADIKKNGVIEPVWLTEDGLLLDGRNRVRAATVAGQTWQTRTYRGDDPVSFVISANVHRRHLTTGQKADIALRALPLYEEEAKKRKAQAPAQPRGAKQSSDGADLPQETKGEKGKRAPRARDKAAKATGTSGRAVAQLKRLVEAAEGDPFVADLVAQVRAGTLALDAAEKKLKAHEKRVKDQEARKRILPPVSDAPTKVEGNDWVVYHGDFRKILAGDEWRGKVAAYVTDPPYPVEDQPLWSDLARIAAHTLEDQGMVIALTGKIHMDQVMARLGQHLDFGWMYALTLVRGNTRILARHIASEWKPWLVYTKGTWPSGRIDFHGDILSSPKDKTDHYWQQGIGDAAELIARLTPKHGLIVDPMVGTGSYGEAAITQERKFVGVDIDRANFERTVERLRKL